MGFLSNKIWVRIFLGHPVDVEEKGCQDRSLWDAVPEVSYRSDDVKSQPSLFLHASQVVKFTF